MPLDMGWNLILENSHQAWDSIVRYVDGTLTARSISKDTWRRIPRTRAASAVSAARSLVESLPPLACNRSLAGLDL